MGSVQFLSMNLVLQGGRRCCNIRGFFSFLLLICRRNINHDILQISATGDNTIGYNVLHAHSLPAGDYWYWLGVGVLLLYALLFNNIVTLALAYLNRKS